MAHSARPISQAAVWGGAAATLAVAVTLLPLGAVFWRADISSPLGPSDWAAVRFTVLQAFVSAAVSVALAVPLARALARRRFPGRGAIVTLLGVPFLLPVIVAVLGLLAVFGRSGWLSDLIVAAGGAPLSVYGFQGVVLAHVFLNLPLATRLVLQGWQTVPSERMRLAASLGMTTRDINRLIERPILREVLPGASLVIFLICTTSFAVALTLGGGPRATTVELAIYQALRFDFDLERAARLALVQCAIAGAAVMLTITVARRFRFGAGLDRAPARRWDVESPIRDAQDAIIITAGAAFLVLPLAALVFRGLPGLAELPLTVLHASLRSLAVALASAALAVSWGLAIALASARSGRVRAGWLDGAGTLALAVSPLVIGTGLFILVTPFFSPAQLALPLTGFVNATLAVPFILRALAPAAQALEVDYGRLSAALSLDGVRWLRIVALPRLAAPLGFSLGLAAALSMGDLGVITLFGLPERGTLPLEMYRLMGAYRMEAASGAALVLLILTLAVFWLFDRGGRFAQAR